MPQTDQDVEVNVSELLLTPFTGASLVNEILKGLVFQKCQIPFPYTWLKSVVEKRRKTLGSIGYVPKKLNFAHENHFRIVSAACDALDSIMKGITIEFCETNSIIKEIAIIFGSTPSSPKEVFTLVLPSTIKGHNEKNHIAHLNKNMQKVLRHIFLSQTWMDSIDASVTCTNTYIYLKKQTEVDTNPTNEAFELCGPLQIPANIKHSKFKISYAPNERTNCCDSLVIFDDNGGHTQQQNKEPFLSEENKFVWCRSKHMIKGFKDCFIDKVSVCELW